MTREPAPEVLFDVQAKVGEGPSWVAHSGRLSFVDIVAGRVFVADLSRIHATVEIGMHVGAALPAADGGFLLARRDGFVRLAPDGTQAPIALPLEHDPDLRFNDGKVDPTGRAWAGTMTYEEGAARGVLYRLDGDVATPVVSGLGLSNGLGWSPDGRTMYLADSRAGTVDAFHYDWATGEATRRRPFLDLSAGPGVPDGLSVDDEGCLWVAMWDGWAVRRFAPDGRELERVEMPVSRPSSCCFAGDALVITTASHGLPAAELAREPHAGALFVARPGVSGPGAVPWPGRTAAGSQLPAEPPPPPRGGRR